MQCLFKMIEEVLIKVMRGHLPLDCAFESGQVLKL